MKCVWAVLHVLLMAIQTLLTKMKFWTDVFECRRLKRLKQSGTIIPCF